MSTNDLVRLARECGAVPYIGEVDTLLMPPNVLATFAARLASMQAEAPAVPKEAAGCSLRIDFRQATELLAMFGGEPTEITLTNGLDHDGPGLYAYYTDLPEEGSINLGVTDEEACPSPAASTPDSVSGSGAEPMTEKQIKARFNMATATYPDKRLCWTILVEFAKQVERHHGIGASTTGKDEGAAS